ncbi:MAG TPA: hypothetical protein EYQ14_04450 [Gammaproteobacteria bacterium]|nr:hypothetical protein [Gammaproteobacteria bacterium]
MHLVGTFSLGMIRIFLTILFACSCQLSYSQSCDSLDSVQWLPGDWTNDDGENIVTESWKRISPLTFEGSGETRSRTSNELQTGESLRLVEMAGEVFYVAKVDHNNRPVAFKLIQCSATSAAFENSDHDFPKKLEYRLNNKNELNVRVSDGKDKGFEISYTRRNHQPGH